MDENVQSKLQEVKKYIVDGKELSEDEFEKLNNLKDIRLLEESKDKFRILKKMNG